MRNSMLLEQFYESHGMRRSRNLGHGLKPDQDLEGSLGSGPEVCLYMPAVEETGQD